MEKAGRDQATIVEADATAENLCLSWGQIKTLVKGYEVAGDELAIWRVHELTVSPKSTDVWNADTASRRAPARM